MASQYLSTSPYAKTSEELVKNEIIIGLGITLLGGAVGFTYAFYKNQKAKQAGLPAPDNDLLIAFEGALVGIIIAILSILLYRIVFHAQAARTIAQVQRETQLSVLQKAQAERFNQVADATKGLQVNPYGARILGIQNSGLPIVPSSAL